MAPAAGATASTAAWQCALNPAVPRLPRHFHILFVLRAHQWSLLVYRAAHDSALPAVSTTGTITTRHRYEQLLARGRSWLGIGAPGACGAPHLTRGRWQTPSPPLRMPRPAAHPAAAWRSQPPWDCPTLPPSSVGAPAACTTPPCGPNSAESSLYRIFVVDGIRIHVARRLHRASACSSCISD